MEMKLQKIDNKGFSLLELLVSFAILAFVTAAIIGLMASGMRFFRTTSSSVGLQYEYQVVMNQISNDIVNCNTGIVFDDTENALYIIVEDIIENPSTPGTFINVFTTYVLVHDTTEDTLYYITPVSNAVEPLATLKDRMDIDITANRSMMTPRMSLFDVDITRDTITNRVAVETDMEFFASERVYRAQQVIALRNNIITVEDDEGYEELIDAIINSLS